MKNILKFGAIALVGLFLLESCAKTLDATWVKYEERGCLPPWASLKSDNRSRNNLESLLKADGIIPIKIKIIGERDLSCTNCFCKTGIVYRVKIDKSQLNLMYHHGFESD